MWVKKGVIQIIDLGNEFFLVNFSNEDDYRFALTEGPWLIFDHYLTVRERCPNFYPSEASLEKAAVWVRLSGLPIEYYDERVLKALGNKIGKTIKVDKTTLRQEWGKYARMCVEVDLLKSRNVTILLNMKACTSCVFVGNLVIIWMVVLKKKRWGNIWSAQDHKMRQLLIKIQCKKSSRGLGLLSRNKKTMKRGDCWTKRSSRPAEGN